MRLRNVVTNGLWQEKGPTYGVERSISLWSELSDLWLLHKVTVALLLSESDSILLGLELDGSSLHEIAGRGPSHQWVLPSSTLWHNIPIHSPALSRPVAALCGGLCLLEDANGAGLEFEWRAGDGSGFEGSAGGAGWWELCWWGRLAGSGISFAV